MKHTIIRCRYCSCLPHSV